MAGTWRKTSESRAAETGWLSPSVRTTTSSLSRLRSEVALAANRRQRVELVAVVTRLDLGGGRSMPTDRSSVALNTSLSTPGKRCGSVRSVSEAMPTGTSGMDARSSDANTFARAIRVGDPASWRASMEREMSTTTKTSASVRVRSVDVRCSTGCAAAAPRNAPAAITAPTATSRCRADGVASSSEPRTRWARR